MTKPSQHLCRCPEEEVELSHINMSLRTALLSCGIVPFLMYLVAIWIAAHPHFTDVDWNPEFFEQARKTWKYNETGNGHIYYTRKDGTIKNMGTWFKEVFAYNMSHYSFGLEHTFCYQRKNESYPHTWSTSIYRATQVYSSVQTPMRYGLLIMMFPMLYLANAISNEMIIRHKMSLYSLIIGKTYFFNELCYYISFFLFLALHVMFDTKYIPYNTWLFTMPMIFSTMKMILRNFTEEFGNSIFFRCIGILIFTFSYHPLKNDVEDYLRNVYCDTFAPPYICHLQLTCIIVLFMNNLYDIQKCKPIFILVSCTKDEEFLQAIPEKSLFRRGKY